MRNSLENELKKLGLERERSVGVGKKIDKNIWLHKNYASDVIDLKDLELFQHQLPSDFEYNLLRVNRKEGQINFIQSPDFDESPEPVVGDMYKVSDLGKGQFESKLIKQQDKNPLIYHHKWLFVKDDYSGFDVQQSKERSWEWKTVLGVDKAMSNKIGRKDFWEQWLNETQHEREQLRQSLFQDHHKNDSSINGFLAQKEGKKTDVWAIYTENRVQQTENSAKTARLQKPRTLAFIDQFNLNKEYNVVLDIGCGSGNEYNKEKLEELGFDYNGCDPFNKPHADNLEVIEKCRNSGADIVTLNNVLNTVPEKEVRKNILEQAEDALKETGLLLMITYEGEKTKSEREYEKREGKKLEKLEPIKTRDGWQNRMKTQQYMEEVAEVFPNVEMITNNGSKIIVASKNPDLDIKNKFQTPRRKVKNG